MPATAAPDAAPRDRARERAVLAAVIIAIALSAVDGTVVTTAMPTAVHRLGGLNLYAWIFAAYELATAVSMPIWGKLADTRGSRNLFMLGVVLFVTGSALCGAAGNMTALVSFRALQGIGAGALAAVPYTVLGVTFPPSERARVIGLGSATWGVASVIGPLLGSAIVSVLGWRWVFYVNVPVGIVAVALAARNVPARPAVPWDRRPTDWLGAALAAAAASALMFGLQVLPHARTEAVVLLAGALAVVAVFVAVEARAADPVLALFLFRKRVFVVINAISFLAAFAIFGVLDYLPLLVPPGIPLAVGAAVLIFPPSAAWSTASVLIGRFVRRIGVRRVAVAGTACMTAAFALLIAVIQPSASLWDIALASAPLGFGIGMLLPALLSGLQNALPLKDMGMGTGAEQFLQMLGGSVGVAALQLAFLSGLRGVPAAVRGAVAQLMAGGAGGATAASFAALTGAMRVGLLVPAAAAALGLALAFAIPGETR